MIWSAPAAPTVSYTPVTQTLLSYPGNRTNHCCLCQAVRFPSSTGETRGRKKPSLASHDRKLVFLFVCCFVFNQYRRYFFTRLSALRQQQIPNILILLPPPVLGLQRWTARYWQTKLTMLLIHIGTAVGGCSLAPKKKRKKGGCPFYKPWVAERERWGNAEREKQLIKSFSLLLCALSFSPSPSVFLSLPSISRAQTQV